MVKKTPKALSGSAIKRLYAWIVRDGDGEGILAVNLGETWKPLIGTDQPAMEMMRPAVQLIATRQNQVIYLKVFGAGVTIDEVTPE